MATRFPLLKLPNLPFDEIVKSLDLWDFVNLSVCSLRTRNSIKSRRIEVSVQVKPQSFIISREDVRFYIDLDYESGRTQVVKMNKTYVRIARKQNNEWIIRNQEFILDEWKLVMDHLLNTFEVSINLEIVGERHLFEFLTGHPTMPKIAELTVNSDFVDDVDMKFYLENSYTDELCFLSNRNKTFRFNGNFGRFKAFTCYPAEWITGENLLSLDCESIDLGKTSLTNDDINMWLEKWIDGKSSNLRELRVEIEKIKLTEIMDGIEVVRKAGIREQNNLNFHVAPRPYILNRDGLKGFFTNTEITFNFDVSLEDDDNH